MSHTRTTPTDPRRPIALVTGAASGIGRAVATVLGRRGFALVLVDRDADALAETSVALAAPDLRTFVVDVADTDAVRACAAAVAADGGSLTVVVHSAGVNLTAPFSDTSTADADWLLAVNLRGTVNICSAFVPLLRAAARGEPRRAAHLVTVASMAGLIGLPTQSLYSASKAAVGAFSEALAIELRHEHIFVTCVYPGAVRTGLLRRARFADPALQARLVDLGDRFTPGPERVAERIVRALLARRLRVRPTLDAWLLDLAARLAPTLLLRVAAWLYPRSMRRASPRPP